MKLLRKIINKIHFFQNRKVIKRGLKEISAYLLEKGVRILYVALPDEHKIKGLTSFELERIRQWSFDFNKYKEELPKLRKIYGDSITESYINSIFDGGIVVQGKNRKILLDFESDKQHIINGRRITIGQPKSYANCIYTHGACTWRGTGVEDQETIASFLQSHINNDYPSSYRVINSAIGRGSTIFDDIVYIKEQQYKNGDIVIIGSHGKEIRSIKPDYFRRIGIEYVETSSCFDRPHDIGEWFNDDTLHTNKRGNQVLANKIYEELRKLDWLTIAPKTIGDEKVHNDSTPDNLLTGEKIYGDNPQLLEYIDSIKQFKRGDNTNRNGGIVMNCNPFTLGHRYLIEYAASKVDFLYIFVVEENKSFFPFEDRFKLVQQGTADLQNVVVLPSGNFIISAVTFPGYFYKDNLKETKIDCSNDLNVFAEYIAPALNIKVRFAGEEPLDPVTKQYNEGMAEILPQHGMEFCEIKRKQDDDGVGVISASRVRKLLKEGEFDELKKLVPPSTFEYLLKLEHD